MQLLYLLSSYGTKYDKQNTEMLRWGGQEVSKKLSGSIKIIYYVFNVYLFLYNNTF